MTLSAQGFSGFGGGGATISPIGGGKTVGGDSGGGGGSTPKATARGAGQLSFKAIRRTLVKAFRGGKAGRSIGTDKSRGMRGKKANKNRKRRPVIKRK